MIPKVLASVKLARKSYRVVVPASSNIVKLGPEPLTFWWLVSEAAWENASPRTP